MRFVGVKRWYFLVIVYAALLIGGWFAADWFAAIAEIDVRPANEPMIRRMIFTAAATFIAASAVPFVPGAEIGFGLLLLLGGQIALLVYLCMVCALTLAYGIGRFVPPSATAGTFRFFGLERASRFVSDLAPLDSDARLAFLTSQAPSRAVPFLLRHRYLALILLLNLPGNSVIGGGGGIAFAAGLSRLFAFPAYIVAVLLAVAPVPLFFLARDLF